MPCGSEAPGGSEGPSREQRPRREAGPRQRPRLHLLVGAADVAEFLVGFSLARWLPLFTDVDGPTLTRLTEADLREIGCDMLLPRATSTDSSWRSSKDRWPGPRRTARANEAAGESASWGARKGPRQNKQKNDPVCPAYDPETIRGAHPDNPRKTPGRPRKDPQNLPRQPPGAPGGVGVGRVRRGSH